MSIIIELLNKDNWLKICELSVSDEQKPIFPIPNVYWIGISRYEEHTTLFAIKYDTEYVGLIGGGLDEDGISGYINPLMIDEKYQERGVAREAMLLIIDYIIRKYHVPCIHINHHKGNEVAGKLYESLGFRIYSETEKEFCRSYRVDYDLKILSLRDYPERKNECRDFLLHYFHETTSHDPEKILNSVDIFPQGYFLLKNNCVIGWVGLHSKEVVAGKVYGWEGTLKQDEIFSENLSPWITPLLVHPDERGHHYGKLLLDHVIEEARKFDFNIVYLTTDHIGYYEKYGFREVGLSTFTWGRPTKVYERSTLQSQEAQI